LTLLFLTRFTGICKWLSKEGFLEIRVQDLMDQSGVKFGTSGARGLAADMTDRVCYIYAMGFLQYLELIGDAVKGASVAIAGDLRPSTDRIMAAVGKAVLDSGFTPINCGKIPSPAVALYGLMNRIPSIMVTGSHIPAERNGIKFNKSTGEILKIDEEGMRRQVVPVEDSLCLLNGSFVSGPFSLPDVDSGARNAYIARYLDFFPKDALSGILLGVYQHSAVGRDILVEIYRGLGADVTILGRSDVFVPVDTEAIREEDVILAAEWCKEQRFFSIVSTDGDSDRPLISDENGSWLRGDVAGILAAQSLEADSVSTPVSCNSAVEKCGAFSEIRRTCIGSPYVIAAMDEAVQSGAHMAVGYEANGGFLTNSEWVKANKRLRALPTRDAVLLHLAIILFAKKHGRTISQLMVGLPQRFTASDRLKDFTAERSHAILARLTTDSMDRDCKAIEDVFGVICGKVTSIDRTDGIRITFENEEVVHLRPSGNAPEFRCYTEADANNRAVVINGMVMGILNKLGSC
jgi:phosphomannomutase